MKKTKEEIRTKWIRHTSLLPLDECVDNAMEEYAAQCQEYMGDISKVTNVEIIHQYGAKYKRNNCKVELSYQDDGRTLKIVISSLNKQDEKN